MPILNMPLGENLPGVKTCQFGLMTNDQVFTSRFTGAAQVEELDGAKWFFSISLPPMNHEQAAAWKAFLVQLRGRVNSFYAFDPDYEILGSNASPSGEMRIDGAGQTGTAINIKAAAVSTSIFAEGDFISFETSRGLEMKMITQAVTSDASGNATLNFEPPLRGETIDNNLIEYSSPRCIMALDESNVRWETAEIMRYGISLSATERIFNV